MSDENFKRDGWCGWSKVQTIDLDGGLEIEGGLQGVGVACDGAGRVLMRVAKKGSAPRAGGSSFGSSTGLWMTPDQALEIIGLMYEALYRLEDKRARRVG